MSRAPFASSAYQPPTAHPGRLVVVHWRFRGTAYADIAEDAMDPDVATHVDGVTSPSDLVAAKEAQLAQLAPGEPPNLELLDGFEEVFPVNADNRWVKPRLFESSIIEQDDDMLDGFGSDWEEDVPVADWFAMGQRAHSTGLQLEELYFQESMVDIKARLDEFAKAHRAAYTPEVRHPPTHPAALVCTCTRPCAPVRTRLVAPAGTVHCALKCPDARSCDAGCCRCLPHKTWWPTPCACSTAMTTWSRAPLRLPRRCWSRMSRKQPRGRLCWRRCRTTAKATRTLMRADCTASSTRMPLLTRMTRRRRHDHDHIAVHCGVRGQHVQEYRCPLPVDRPLGAGHPWCTAVDVRATGER